MKPPLWFCTGWWSPWCVLDELLHRLFGAVDEDDMAYPLPGPMMWICDKHEAALLRSVGEDPDPYLESDRRYRRVQEEDD